MNSDLFCLTASIKLSIVHYAQVLLNIQMVSTSSACFLDVPNTHLFILDIFTNSIFAAAGMCQDFLESVRAQPTQGAGGLHIGMIMEIDFMVI